MPRFFVCQKSVILDSHVMLAQADKPDQALSQARQYIEAGRKNIKIRDSETNKYYEVDVFAKQHGVRMR